MPDGEFFNYDKGYVFSKEESGITLSEDAEGGYEFDVAFIKEGYPNRVFTEDQLDSLERNPFDTWEFFQIPEEELVKARAYIEARYGADNDHLLEAPLVDELSM